MADVGAVAHLGVAVHEALSHEREHGCPDTLVTHTCVHGVLLRWVSSGGGGGEQKIDSYNRERISTIKKLKLPVRRAWRVFGCVSSRGWKRKRERVEGGGLTPRMQMESRYTEM